MRERGEAQGILNTRINGEACGRTRTQRNREGQATGMVNTGIDGEACGRIGSQEIERGAEATALMSVKVDWNALRSMERTQIYGKQGGEKPYVQ